MPSKPVVVNVDITGAWINITVYSMDASKKVLEELPYFGEVVGNGNKWVLFPSEGFKGKFEEIVNYLQSLIDN